MSQAQKQGRWGQVRRQMHIGRQEGVSGRENSRCNMCLFFWLVQHSLPLLISAPNFPLGTHLFPTVNSQLLFGRSSIPLVRDGHMIKSDQSEQHLPLVSDWLMNGHLTRLSQPGPMRLSGLLGFLENLGNLTTLCDRLAGAERICTVQCATVPPLPVTRDDNLALYLELCEPNTTCLSHLALRMLVYFLCVDAKMDGPPCQWMTFRKFLNWP